MSRITVEDHDYGYMVVAKRGRLSIKKARKVMRDYVDDPDLLQFATPNHYEGMSAVWLTWLPGAMWYGATCLHNHASGYATRDGVSWVCVECRSSSAA